MVYSCAIILDYNTHKKMNYILLPVEKLSEMMRKLYRIHEEKCKELDNLDMIITKRKFENDKAKITMQELRYLENLYDTKI